MELICRIHNLHMKGEEKKGAGCLGVYSIFLSGFISKSKNQISESNTSTFLSSTKTLLRVVLGDADRKMHEGKQFGSRCYHLRIKVDLL